MPSLAGYSTAAPLLSRHDTGWVQLGINQLLSHSSAIAAPPCMTPGHHAAIGLYGSEGSLCGVDMLHISQLLSHSSAIAAALCITPGQHAAIGLHGSESTFCGP